jgi:hypothetical protein
VLIANSQFVLDDDRANLPDLIRLCLRPYRLKVYDLGDAIPRKYMVISADAFVKA